METVDQLRVEFESMAKSNFFGVERFPNGEYVGTTFILWAGYWECAKANGIIPDDSDVLKMNDIESAASKVLRGKGSSKAVKTARGSALTQR